MHNFQHSAVLKYVDTSPVVTAKVSTHAITLTRQSLDESNDFKTQQKFQSGKVKIRTYMQWQYKTPSVIENKTI